MEKQQYTITIFSESRMGLLNKITNVFTRRRMNIISLTACESTIQNVSRWTILVEETEQRVRKLVTRIESLVDILKVTLKTNDEIVYQEITLFKIPLEVLTSGKSVEKIIRKHSARILEVTPSFAVIEHTGHEKGRVDIFNELKKLGTILQVARSGRIAVSRSDVEELEAHLKEIAEARVKQQS